MRIPALAPSLSAAAALLLAAVAFATSPAPAELVVTDARIYTANPAHSVAQAMAISGDRIVFVGSAADARKWIGPKTRVEKLDGRLVLPGLFDSHIHPIGIIEMDACDLRNEGKSLAEMAEFVRGGGLA